jgi:ATP-dependent RNA helicase DDX49/DBP8
MELFSKHHLPDVKIDILDKNKAKNDELKSQLSSTTNLSSSFPYTFKDLGLCNWLCKSIFSMGFRRPTDIQTACIPAIIQGKSVIGCAETGSGKTAAFALPILQHLSIDPYGIFAVILTPTRELAVQIHEQIAALGSTFHVKQALIIGGESITKQSLELSKVPHIVIATPGRFRHHLLSADPPNLRKCQYLVLDEADRLLAYGFSSELKTIVAAASNPKRQTLLFSATMTASLSELESLTNEDTLRFDLTLTQKLPTRLVQQYIFIPAKVKICYLVAIIRKFFESLKNIESRDEESGYSSNNVVQEIVEELTGLNRKSKRFLKGNGERRKKKKTDDFIPTYSSSLIIFVSSCRKCAEISTVLQQLDIPCVGLHSMLPQYERSKALDTFKSRRVNVLVATDVAGRGLDIPSVDLVINVDMPKIANDYIHRVGRTARAGKVGRALSLITQYDIDLVHAVEDCIGLKLEESQEIDEERDIVPILNEVAKARREAQLKLMEKGFDEKLEIFKKRKRKQRRKLLYKIHTNINDKNITS